MRSRIEREEWLRKMRKVRGRGLAIVGLGYIGVAEKDQAGGSVE